MGFAAGRFSIHTCHKLVRDPWDKKSNDKQKNHNMTIWGLAGSQISMGIEFLSGCQGFIKDFEVGEVFEK